MSTLSYSTHLEGGRRRRVRITIVPQELQQRLDHVAAEDVRHEERQQGQQLPKVVLHGGATVEIKKKASNEERRDNFRYDEREGRGEAGSSQHKEIWQGQQLLQG